MAVTYCEGLGDLSEEMSEESQLILGTEGILTFLWWAQVTRAEE
jgi:hypothetical protein